jgi:hypothetical protein
MEDPTLLDELDALHWGEVINLAVLTATGEALDWALSIGEEEGDASSPSEVPCDE